MARPQSTGPVLALFRDEAPPSHRTHPASNSGWVSAVGEDHRIEPSALLCNSRSDKEHLQAKPSVTINRRFDRDGLSQAFTRRPCAAMETRRPGNPPPSAARAGGGEGSAADWDPARSPCDKDARWRGRAAG